MHARKNIIDVDSDNDSSTSNYSMESHLSDEQHEGGLISKNMQGI